MFLLLLIFLYTGKCHPVLMFKNHLNIHKHYIYIYVYIYKYKEEPVVEGDQFI